MSEPLNVATFIADLIQSEGVTAIEGCEHDRSLAGALLAGAYGCPRWAAEALIRKSLRTIGQQLNEYEVLAAPTRDAMMEATQSTVAAATRSATDAL